MAWTRPDNLHSRLVFWFKILLPLCALILLSTLFMVSRTIRPEDAIPYAEVDVADLMRKPRLSAPDFSGVTTDGAALSMTADTAFLGQPDAPESGVISGLVGVLETPDGARTDFAASQAHLDQTGNRVMLDGGVNLSNSAGYSVQTQSSSVALDKTNLESEGPITAKGPVGSITAGRLRLGLAEQDPGSYVLVFENKVRMIYLPAKQEAGN